MTATLELHLIRHAQSEANMHPEIIGGQNNSTPLTAQGEIQARLLGQYLREEGISFDKVYASPAIRAAQTAQIVCSYLKHPPKIRYTANLLELSQGDWSGMVRSKHYTADAICAMNADPQGFRAPNGESKQEVENRGLKFLEDIRYTTQRERVAVFGHGMHFKCLLHGILDFDPRMTWKLSIDNTSVTKLRYDDVRWHLDYFNSTTHLKVRP